ncbi:MAG: SDR family oxidoreductase [Anaerolineaceae bacterium]|nr:SDR family oxidoreductase [Anaerolineaceae bacterium]
MPYTIDLSDKVAAVTGGSGVLGSAMCKALAAAGATVAVMGTTRERAASTSDAILADGGAAMPLAVNVLERDTLQAAREAILTVSGNIDILINCAGGNDARAMTSPDNARNLFNIDQDALQWTFDLNFFGTLLACQELAQPMAEAGQGVIVNISSMAAQRPLTRVLAYAAAKAGIDNFTRWLAVYLAQEYNPQIRVNAIAPGFFITEQNRLIVSNEDGSLKPRGQQIVDHTPMGRLGQPEELVGTLLWLVSEGARFVTGTVIPVDGGFSAYSGV